MRPPHLDDVPDIARLANNYGVAKMLARMPHPYFEADAREWVEARSTTAVSGCVYAITNKADGTFMGSCGIHEDRERYELPFIGYWLGEPFWGQGFATETAQALCDLFFRASDRDTLLISCRRENAGSRRVIEKCGGVFWKTGRQFNPALGEMHDLLHFRLTRENRLAAQAT